MKLSSKQLFDDDEKITMPLDSALSATTASTLVDALGVCALLPSTTETARPSLSDSSSAAPTPASYPATLAESEEYGDGDLKKVIDKVTVDLDGYRIDPFLVDFASGDPEDPYAWSASKKRGFTALIMLLTFTVYSGSAILYVFTHAN
jgi:hypothetical protein